ncbi:pentapeptide repeat-containing protein [Streptosporangium canum]|uniref:pentapeptide repeat-containing protein n=1 Tax=Streptosporangium canum TaxID=324952 RepID=UPI0033ACA490
MASSWRTCPRSRGGPQGRVAGGPAPLPGRPRRRRPACRVRIAAGERRPGGRAAGAADRPAHPQPPPARRTPRRPALHPPGRIGLLGGDELDLTGATLIDFDLFGGHVTKAVFSKATFTGDARFDGATFTEDAMVSGATFTRNAWFVGGTFTGNAGFVEATFTGDADFGGAMVANPEEPHSWPGGWRLETTPEGAGRLTREEADGVPAGD